MKRVEVCQGSSQYGARTRTSLVRAIRRSRTRYESMPVVRGTATALIEHGAYVTEGGDPMRPIIEFAPGEYVQCEVMS